MKNLWKWPLAILGLVIFQFPIIVGFLYVLAMLVAGGVAIFYTNVPELATNVLSYGWKIYLSCAVLTFTIMTTFIFQNCCVGVDTFRSHLRHAGVQHLEALFAAVIWPYGWYRISNDMSSWGISWLHIVVGALEYWFVTIWKGVKIESWNLQTGEIQVTHAKTLEETRQNIQHNIHNLTK